MSKSIDAQREPINISWVKGLELAVEVRKHRILVDQPLEEGGQDQGMTPVEMFVGSLGACIGYFAVHFCRRHKIPTAGLKVVMEWGYAEQPHRVGTMTAHVELPAKLVPVIRDRLHKVLEGCTIHESLTHPPKITIELR